MRTTCCGLQPGKRLPQNPKLPLIAGGRHRDPPEGRRCSSDSSCQQLINFF